MKKKNDIKIRDAELARRKQLTFEQAEGEPLPTQMQPGVISRELRARLWEPIHQSLSNCTDINGDYIQQPWLGIAYEKFVYRDHKMADDFSAHSYTVISEFRNAYASGTFVQVFGLTQWILRHEDCPEDLQHGIADALEKSHSAYTLIDGDTIMPISSEAEVQAVQRALESTKTACLDGPHFHLKSAAAELSNGNWAASIRESIHAVEAVAKIIEPSANTLRPALAALTKKGDLHEAMKSGFSNLYGFTSDEKGIRHSLLEKGDANVDAIDAQYMLGACASFVSYLLSRTRAKS